MAAALVALPLRLMVLGFRLLGSSRDKGSMGKVVSQSDIMSLCTMLPIYLWLAIFSLQPHKEERFMYPIYPFGG